jgi:hypothetical protein
MSWFVIIGMAVSGWTILLLLSSERQRRLFEIEAKRQVALAEMQKQAQKPQQLTANR